MLSRSVNILLYFHLVIQQIVFVIVTKGTPRAGHPLKEGLRQCLNPMFVSFCLPRAGHPLKEGLRPLVHSLRVLHPYPRAGHPLKEGLRLIIVLIAIFVA